MALKLNIEADGVAKSGPKTGRRIREQFNLIGTPTLVAHAVITEGDKFKAYSTYVEHVSEGLHWGQTHLQELWDWMNLMAGKGLEIRWYES